jgi:hypothetical protein
MNPLAELDKLLRMFDGGQSLLADVRHVPAALLPEPYRRLLAHDQHMTVTMEAYHGSPVRVEVLNRSQRGLLYCREILLRLAEDGRLPKGTVVQYGLVRFDLQYVTEMVRKDLLEERIPLGRVLISHNVLRHIDPGALLEVRCGAPLAAHFGVEPGALTHGRMATIFCNREPAVDLLEISRPLDAV